MVGSVGPFGTPILAAAADRLQAVILAGGLGTRLLPITQTVPKALVPVCGRPFLEYQLALLRSHGIRDVVLCVGYLGELIEAHFRDGSRFGMSIRYGYERAGLLGTAGALKNVDRYLRDVFFVTYGDGYLRLDYRRIMAYFLRRDCLGLMVTFKNRDRFDRSNVVVEGRFVVRYDKQQWAPGMEHIDFGVAVLRRGALGYLAEDRPASLEELYGRLVTQHQLLAYQSRHRFYEIGSPAGLAEFENVVRAGRVSTPMPTPALAQ